MAKDISINDYLEDRGLLDDLYVSKFHGLEEECGLLKLPSGWVETRYWLPITDDRYFFLDFSGTVTEPKYAQFSEPAFDVRLDPDATDALSNVFMLGGDQNYFHMMMDYFPRLVFLHHLPQLRDIPLAVDADLPASYRHILLALLSRVGAKLPPTILPVPRDQVFRLERAFVPGLIPRPVAVRIWETLLMPSIPKSGPERIFVTRGDAQRRRLLNEEEIADRLGQLGFVTVDPGCMSFEQQVQAFSGARIVVGVHGAGLTNLLFSPRGGHLIELQVGPVQPFYFDLSTAKGFRYSRLREVSKERASDHHGDFEIKPDPLMDLVQDVLQEGVRQEIRSSISAVTRLT